MKYEWHLETPEFAVENSLKMEYVLIEYDGPQLAIFKGQNKRRYIGLAADSEQSVDRWIHAPITPLELEGLCTRGVPMRNVVCKDGMEVVDYENDKPRRRWRISADQIPFGILPVVGAYLPSGVASVAYKALKLGKHPAIKDPLFRLAGRHVKQYVISFYGLSIATQALQKLWTAIGDAVLPPLADNETNDGRIASTTLAFAAPARGSFGIVLGDYDENAFEAIAAKYKELVCIAPDSDIEVLKTKLSPTILTAYSEYLSILEKNEIEVLTNWGDQAAFIGYRYATEIGPIIASAGKKKASAGQENKLIPMKGYFDGLVLNKGKKFIFFNTQTGEVIAGTVPKALAKKLMDKKGIHVGHQTVYNINVVIKDDEYILKDAIPVQRSMFE